MNKEEYLERVRKSMMDGIKEHENAVFDNIPADVQRTIAEFHRLTGIRPAGKQKSKWISDARLYNTVGCQNMSAVLDFMRNKGIYFMDIGSIIKSAQAWMGEQAINEQKKAEVKYRQ